MKIVIIICAAFYVVCNCYQFPNVITPKYYVPIINIKGSNESMVFVRQNSTDNLLLKSLLETLYTYQTVIIARGTGFSRIRKSQHNHDPNIIILTDRIIEPYELKSQAYKTMFYSYWSPVYIIVTMQNGTESCENGKFNETYLHNAEACMAYIWRRYKVVQVVISFPYTCPNHYIIYGENKPKDSLYDRKIKIIMAENKKVLRRALLDKRKFKNLTVGYPLRANIFDRFPTSITDCDNIGSYRKVNLSNSNGFCGLDGLVMNDFITYYRYNLTIPKDKSCDLYGFMNPITNRMTGSLGCLVNKKIDISFNSRFMVMYTAKHYSYLHYITTDILTAVMKIPGVIPLWHFAYSCYSPKTAIILGILTLVIGVLTWASAWILMDIDDREPRRLYVYIINAVTSTLFGFPINRSHRFRILRGTSLLCSIILLAYYQGHVNNVFTTRPRYKEMKTLKELYRSEYLLYSSPSIRNLLITNANKEDKEQALYFKQMVTKDGNIGLAYVLKNDRAAITERGQDAQIQVVMNFTDEAGSPLMYVLEEPFHKYYLSYICGNGFLFTEETVLFMMRLLEAGLPKKYYEWTRLTIKLGDTYAKTSVEPRPVRKIAVRHVRVAFIVLATGYLLAAMSFIAEVYVRNISKKKYAAEHRSSAAEHRSSAAEHRSSAAEHFSSAAEHRSSEIAADIREQLS